MSDQIIVYFYATDPQIETYNLKLTPIKNDNPTYSVNSQAAIYPIYDSNFNEIGKMKRFGTNVSELNLKNQYISWYYTIYFYKDNNSVSFEINDIESFNPYFKPYVPINSVITSCSGSIYASRGTVQIYPYDNKVKSRKIIISLY